MEDLKVRIGTGNFQITAPSFHRMECIGKGLAAAMVGDGKGSVTPCGCLLDDGFCIGQRIHVTHGSMQMQLHPLLAFLEVLTFGHLAGHNGKGFQYRLVGIVIHQELALDFQHRTVFHALQNRLRLFILQETADSDRGCIIGHIKIDDPGIALFQFLMLYRKNAAFYDNDAHIQAHILHGDSFSLKGFAVNGTVIHRRSLFFRRTAAVCGQAGNHRGTHGVHGFKQGFTLQILSGLDNNIHLYTKLLLKLPAYRRNALPDHILTVGHKVDMQGVIFPNPFGTCKAASEHRVLRDKQLHQIVRFYTLQAGCGIYRLHRKVSKTIQ